MRTLQRLQHRRSPSPRTQERIQEVEKQAIARFERRIWLNRLRRIGPWLIVLAAVAALVAWVVKGRVVIDGLVQANLVVERAPQNVRVAEVFVSPGQHCRTGDPLVRLESLVGKGERRALALEVERRALRLELAQAGGELEVAELGHRRDQSLLADLEARVAAAELATAETRLETLILTAESEKLALQQQHDLVSGEVATYEERVREAEARVSAALAGLEVAGFDAESTAELNAEGITARRDVISKRSEEEEARSELDSETAAAEALRREGAAARRQQVLTWQRIEAHKDETDARVETARMELDALSRRQEAWAELAELRRRILPDELPDAELLYELELALLEVELAEAQARLDEFDGAVGNVVLRAAFDGVVDQVLVGAGFVATKGAELVSYYDPESLRVVAYAPAKEAGGLRTGERCSIFPDGSSERLQGRIASRGYTWVPNPPALRIRDDRPAGLRLPMTVDYELPEGEDPLTPNRRVRLVFGFDSEWEAGLVGE